MEPGAGGPSRLPDVHLASPWGVAQAGPPASGEGDLGCRLSINSRNAAAWLTLWGWGFGDGAGGYRSHQAAGREGALTARPWPRAQPWSVQPLFQSGVIKSVHSLETVEKLSKKAQGARGGVGRGVSYLAPGGGAWALSWQPGAQGEQAAGCRSLSPVPQGRRIPRAHAMWPAWLGQRQSSPEEAQPGLASVSKSTPSRCCPQPLRRAGPGTRPAPSHFPGDAAASVCRSCCPCSRP